MERKDMTPRSSMSAFVLRTLQSFQSNFLGFNRQPAITANIGSASGSSAGKGSKRRFLTETSSESGKSSANRTGIDVSPRLPRQSLRLRPLPAPTKPTPSLGERLVQHLHEASAMIRVHSDALLYVHSTAKKPRSLVRSAEIRRARSAALDISKLDNQAEKVVVLEDAKTPENIDGAKNVETLQTSRVPFKIGMPFQYSASMLAPTSEIGIATSTPNSDELDMKFVIQTRNSQLDLLSISTVDSCLEDQHVRANLQTFGDVLMQVGFDYDKGMLTVAIHRCRNLPSISQTKIQFPCPYVKVYLCGAKGGRIKRKTDVKFKTVNPLYGEVLTFPVADKTVANWFLHVAVCYKEGFLRRIGVIGETTMLITEHLLARDHPVWMPLHKTAILS